MQKKFPKEVMIMSQNIDKVNVQIPGTMYYLQLAADRGRWILSLLLRGDVENEAIVPVFSKTGIIKAANELLNNSRLVIDKYPLKNVCDQLFAEAERSLPVSAVPVQIEEHHVESDDLAEFKQKLDLIDNSLNNVIEEHKESIDSLNERLDTLENERVSRLEKEIAKDIDRGDEEMYTSLVDRIDKIEEALAGQKGDDRVPALLTAIEALETKVKHLEGKSITSSELVASEPVTFESESISMLKDDIGRLTRAFDLINQRLTTLEAKLAPKEQPPIVIEGAPEEKPVEKPKEKPENEPFPEPPFTEE